MTSIPETKTHLAGLLETLSQLIAQARASQQALPPGQVAARLALAELERLAQQACAEVDDMAAQLEPKLQSGPPLTAREMEVLRLAAEGLTNKEIAYRLGVSERTAQFHLNSVYNKTGVNSRAEATAVAYKNGWLT